MEPPKATFSLASDDVARRVKRRAELTEQIEAAQKELEGHERWLEAVSLVFPNFPDLPIIKSTSAAHPTPAGHSRTRDWGDIVASFVLNAPAGLSPREIADAIEAGDDEESKERLFQNPNGHHSGLERLLIRQKIVRHNGRYYSPEVYKDLSDRDALPAPLSKVSRHGIFNFVAELIEQQGPMLPNDVVKHLRAHQEYSRLMGRNPQYGYTVLSRAVKRNILVNDGAYYKVAPKENEPSGVSPPNGSDAGSDENGRSRTLRLV